MIARAERYLRLCFSVNPSAEESFVAEMWSARTLGLELADSPTEPARYLVYFRMPVESDIQALVEGKRSIAEAQLLEATEMGDRDWLELYRQSSRPFALARQWWVDPRQPGGPAVPVPAGRRLLEVPAWTAFGTGTHESTALIVQLLEDVPLDSKTVLDVGTGTGILAMVAMKSGASSVTALDIDPVAAIVARQTCRLNRLAPGIFAGSIDALRHDPDRRGYDIVLANVIPRHLRPDLPAVLNHLQPDGRLLLSGILVEQEIGWRAELRQLGVEARRRLQDGDWVALHLEKESR